MAKIILTSDSTSDLSLELKEKVNLHVVPLIVNIEGKEYKDGVDIDSDYIYDSVARTGVLPKTAALSIGEFTEFFNSVRESEDDIILHFSISSGFSSSYQNSVLAASDMKNVYAFDSFNLSTGIGLQILEADRLIKEGLDIEDIIMRLQDYKERVDASFIIDKLDYLQKGGRCSAVTGLVANLLHLKPCIEVVDGKMGVGKKYRGTFERVLNQYINDKLTSGEVETEEVFITHAGVNEEVVNMVSEKVKSYNIFKNVYVTRAGATISSHCGRNTLGVLFVKKNKK